MKQIIDKEKVPEVPAGVKTVLLINGPNLNMLGQRNPHHYGSFSLKEVETAFAQKALELGVQARFFQSNCEGEIIDAIHAAMGYAAGIVINAGALTHYSYAVFDALSLIELPVMEVHISDIHKREPFRHISVISPACVDQVAGLGMNSYIVGLEKLVKEHLKTASSLPLCQKQMGTPNKAQTQYQEENSGELKAIRQAIDNVDQNIIALFAKRMEIANSVAAYKKASQKPVFDGEREKLICQNIQQSLPEDLKLGSQALMKTLMRLSRGKQYSILKAEDASFKLNKILNKAMDCLPPSLKVIYPGSQGSYSQKASDKLFPDADIRSTTTFLQACEAVLAQKADVAVLPVQNSTAGQVEYVYELLQKLDLYVVKATSLPIEHRLVVLPGTKIENIRTIISHPQAISQCSEIIQNKGWKIEYAENTAFAPLCIKEKQDSSWGAIASAEAAQVQGLEILPLEICNNEGNQTRFIAVTSQLYFLPQANRISLLMHLPHESGSLVSALEILADRGVNLTSISSRPLGDKPWEYAFFLDFICQDINQAVETALYQLEKEMSFIKFLGWYTEEI